MYGPVNPWIHTDDEQSSSAFPYVCQPKVHDTYHLYPVWVHSAAWEEQRQGIVVAGRKSL